MFKKLAATSIVLAVSVSAVSVGVANADPMMRTQMTTHDQMMMKRHRMMMMEKKRHMMMEKRRMMMQRSM